MSENETIADIVEEMRHGLDKSWHEIDREWAHGLPDRIKAAAEREIPQPDPDWKTICEKCMDGDIEPYYCEYHGEPNGCNSPLYGQHPNEKHGNAAAMREALLAVKESIDGIGASSLDCDPIILVSALTQICARLSSRINAALAAPLKNCDRYSHDEALEIWAAEKENGYNGCFDEWLYSTAKT